LGIIVLLYALIPFLPKLGQTQEVLEQGLPFYQIIVLTVFPSLIYQGYKQFTDGVGRTHIAMYIMLFGVLISILGNYLLIYGHWGFPKMGLTGAAVATLFARSLMAVMMAIYVHFNSSFSNYREGRKAPLEGPLMKYIMKLGIP